jgi:flagellar basal-body rod modification protein FlgD
MSMVPGTGLGGISPTSTSTNQSGTASTQGQNPLSQMDSPNAFLDLLVAELKYQDPLNPVSGTQFMGQLAELTQVQTLESLSQTVTSEAATNEESTATSLLGKQATATTKDGKLITGQVESAKFSSNGTPQVEIGSTWVSLSAIEQVSEPGSGGGT